MTRIRRSDLPPPTEAGSVLVLMLGFAVVAVLLVAVVTDASALFLTRRSLSGSADGAAIAAVQQLDREAFYTGPAGAALPLDPERVLDAVRIYVSSAQLDARYEGFEVVEVRTDAETVTVTFRATRRLPFLGSFVGGAEGIEIEATATARAPYVD